MAEHLVAKSLKIVDDKGATVASLEPADGGAGLWITGPDGMLVAIYSIKGQTAIGIYDQQSQKDSKGMSLALTVAEGVPQVQFRDKEGEPQWVTLADLAAALAKQGK